MIPNYERAAEKAIETIVKYEINPAHTDPLYVLSRLRNVLLIPYSTSVAERLDLNDDNLDAFSIVNNDDGKLQYIVVYNQSTLSLRLALARELGHVVLNHDGNSTESVWLEEALCFAYHFICPLQLLNRKKTINYRPQRRTISAEMKELKTFDSVDHLKLYIVETQNRKNRFIGKPIVYEAEDVELRDQRDVDCLSGWHNCFDVVVDGQTIGFCGE